MPLALGDRRKTAYLEQGPDDLGATTKITTAAGTAVSCIAVQLESGDALVSLGVVSPPSVLKIDTEGCELDVLRGLQATLQRQTLRVVCVEVHFQLLEERGVPDAPSRIERMLTTAGFDVAWPDPSHIVATRAGA
jgi:hypothetical protein